MVPSDPIPSLALHRHARYRAPHREALCVPPFRSPEADFFAPGSLPTGTPQSLSSTEPASRNGLSLAHNGCSLSEASIPGSTVPTCYFKTSRLVSPPGPLETPCLHWFAPGDGRFLAPNPLQFFSPDRSAASSVSTPLRDSYIPRDQSVQQIPPPHGSPSEPARFPLAPRRRFYC